MRHTRKWLWWLAQCAVAVPIIHLATGAGLLRSMAVLALFLWAGLLAMQALAKLLEAFSCPCDDDEGDDGGGPEEHPPVVINPEPEEPKRQEWRS
jgi:hypothetical protein